MSKQVKVAVIPDCDICKVGGVKRPAYADARMASVGSWFYVCDQHFIDYGCQLGTGVGQVLIGPDG